MNKKVFISAICAVLLAIPTYYIVKTFSENALLWSVFGGLLFYAILFPCLYISEKKSNKRYNEAEKMITSPIWYQLNGNIRTLKSVRNANIYFTDGGIVIISLDKKPYELEEILLPQIEKYESDNICKLRIFTTDGRLLDITSPEIKNLKDHGWIKYGD